MGRHWENCHHRDLVLDSPLVIGGGEQSGSGSVDISVLRNCAGKPYIPASSLAGALRHHIHENILLNNEEKQQAKYFWGEELGRQQQSTLGILQSALTIDDLLTDQAPVIRIRDGVSIDMALGTAIDGNKYDYEVVEPFASAKQSGAIREKLKFSLRMEIQLREGYDTHVFRRMAALLVQQMQESQIALGAITTKGFGRCHLDRVNIQEYDYRNIEHVIAWMTGHGTSQTSSTLPQPDFSILAQDFKLSALFTIKNSLIVRSYSSDPRASDAVHITSGDAPVMPGTSLIGALRSRAWRIIKTLGGEPTVLIPKLFGDVNKVTKEKYKSRITVKENPIHDVTQELQHRIRIDRFTGGAAKTALFDSTPLWPGKKGEMMRIDLSIKKCDPWMAGLLMLVLKDLWNGDLALGGEKNIGRGTLKGLSADITYNGKLIRLREIARGDLHTEGPIDELEKHVLALVQYCGGKEAVNE